MFCRCWRSFIGCECLRGKISSSVHSYTSVWTAMDQPTSLTVFNEWQTSSHVDACGCLRHHRWSSRWHVVQHWETVRFRSSRPGLGTPYQTMSPTYSSFHTALKTYLFSQTFWHWQHASHWLCNVVLKRCCACTTLIRSYDEDDEADDVDLSSL